MKIKEKIMLDRIGLQEFGPINIVIFGDSVSHGAVNGYIDYENVYWNILKKKLNAFREYMPVNMINVSIGGTTAAQSLSRTDSQVLNHTPDLVIVCFGLNDVNGGLESYLNALKQIFEKCQNAGCDVIFMTPNMLNTRVAEDTPKEYFEYAKKTAEMQNNGRMDSYIYSAKKLAEDMGVTVCDCYSKWKKLSETEDITMLLANRINHPTSEMHNLFADSLYELIMGDGTEAKDSDSTMFENRLN
jgi:lysophospholipase L1-like esterase